MGKFPPSGAGCLDGVHGISYYYVAKFQVVFGNGVSDLVSLRPRYRYVGVEHCLLNGIDAYMDDINFPRQHSGNGGFPYCREAAQYQQHEDLAANQPADVVGAEG